jgi:hypothetical protein
MVHVTSLSSAVYLATLPFYGLASTVQEYGSTEGIMTGYSSKYYEKNLSYRHLVSHKSHMNSPVELVASKGGGGGNFYTNHLIYTL